MLILQWSTRSAMGHASLPEMLTGTISVSCPLTCILVILHADDEAFFLRLGLSCTAAGLECRVNVSCGESTTSQSRVRQQLPRVVHFVFTRHDAIAWFLKNPLMLTLVMSILCIMHPTTHKSNHHNTWAKRSDTGADTQFFIWLHCTHPSDFS